ncbi:MAG: Na+/H+ antiporter NhaC family protein [Lachnospiraceae bacterium]|nr:Na+/H+ antiporter NhaC family protein [Lachnospiraceae bacterium]
MNDKKTKGSIVGLLPLIAFLVIYMGIGIFTGSFDNMPLMVGIIIAVGIGLLLPHPEKDKKVSFEERVNIMCRGGGDYTLIQIVLIYILAGAFYGVANSMHAVDSVVNIGLTILPSNMILPGLFLIGCLLSFSMGTSMGTVAALIPIGVEVANKTGINVALVCGIVVGGAMFGDNLSFISDTTIAATRTQEVEMKDKFKTNILMVLPAVILNVVLLFFFSGGSMVTENPGSFDIVNLIPYVLVIVLSILGMNVVAVMSLGVFSGMLIGVIHGDFTWLQSLTVIHDGMSGMEDMAVITIFVGGMVALMQYLGGIDYLLEKLTAGTKSAKGGELSIAALVSLLDIATTNNTVSIIAAGPIARDIADKFEIDRKRVASILDIFSSAFNGLLPYAGQLLVAGGLAGITPTDIMVYNWYSMLMLVFGVIFILIGFPKFQNK